MLKQLDPKFKANIIKVAPWGSPNGVVQEYPGNFANTTRLRSITVAHATIIISIEYSCETNGALQTSHRWGGLGGEVKEVVFEDDEFLTSIKGSYGFFNGVVVVKSLEFISGGVSKGNFGIEGENTFSISLSTGNIVGFHGTSDAYLHSVGLYLKQQVNTLPNGNQLVLPIITNPWGVGGHEMQNNALVYVNANTRLTEITIKSGSVIDSLFYTCETDGVDYQSGPFGGQWGDERKVILQDGEYLTSIKGTFNYYEEKLVVSSLEFASNLNGRIGPFGVVNGTSFSFSLTNGQIVGFNGRYDQFVYAIGVMVTAAPNYGRVNQIKFILRNYWKAIAGGTSVLTLGVCTLMVPTLSSYIQNLLDNLICGVFPILCK